MVDRSVKKGNCDWGHCLNLKKDTVGTNGCINLASINSHCITACGPESQIIILILMYSYYRSLYSFPPLICEHQIVKTPQYWTDQEVKKRKLSNQPGLSSTEIEILTNMDNIYFIFLSQRTEARSRSKDLRPAWSWAFHEGSKYIPLEKASISYRTVFSVK